MRFHPPAPVLLSLVAVGLTAVAGPATAADARAVTSGVEERLNSR